MPKRRVEEEGGTEALLHAGPGGREEGMGFGVVGTVGGVDGILAGFLDVATGLDDHLSVLIEGGEAETNT